MEELAAPLRETPYEELAAEYLNTVDAFDFTREGVWIQAEVEAFLEDRKAGPGSPLVVSVQVTGKGLTDFIPVSTIIWVDGPGTTEGDT